MDQKTASINLRNGASFRPMGEFRQRPSESRPTGPASSGDGASEKDSKFVFRTFDKVIGFSIFMLFLGIPLFFTGLTSQGVVFEKQLYFYFWLLLGLAAWAAKGVMKGEMDIRRTPLDLPILGAWLAYAAATAFSIDRWHSFWGAFSDPSRSLMSVTAYLIAFYFIISNFDKERLKMIFGAVISSGAIVIIWTLLAILGVKFLPESLIQYSPVSLLGSITSLGIFFSALVPLIAVAVLKTAEDKELGSLKRKILIGAHLAALLLNLFLILAIYDYVPWLGFFIGIVIFLVFILAKIVRPNPAWIWLPMVLFVLVMILRMIGSVGIAKITLPVEVSLNYKTSLEIAQASLKDNFLLGSGPATYGYNFSAHKPQDFNLNAFYNLRFFQGTGILAEAVPTVGAIGSIFILIAILSFVGTLAYYLYRDKEKNKLYSLGVFSAALILLVNVLTIQVNGAVLAIAALLASLALAVGAWESDLSGKKLSLSLKTSPKFALALAFVFMVVSAGVAFLFVFLGKVYASDIFAGRAARTVGTNPDGAILSMGKAIGYNPREARYFTELSRYYMALANQEAAKGEKERNVEKIVNNLNRSIAIAKQAGEMSKNDVTIIESLALVYENAGLYVADSFKSSEENYSRAKELDPHNPVYNVKLGQIKIGSAAAKKETAEKKQLVGEARDFFRKATEEKGNYAEGFYQWALAEEALGNLDSAIDNGVKAVQLGSRNVNYLLSLGRMYQSRNKNEDMKEAEKYFRGAVALNDKDINGHFYLGLHYEKNKKKQEAKDQYEKVIALIEESPSAANNTETVGKLKMMIQNVDRGVENTPQNLGLVETPAPTSETETPAESNIVPAGSPSGPGLEEGSAPPTP